VGRRGEGRNILSSGENASSFLQKKGKEKSFEWRFDEGEGGRSQIRGLRDNA